MRKNCFLVVFDIKSRICSSSTQALAVNVLFLMNNSSELRTLIYLTGVLSDFF